MSAEWINSDNYYISPSALSLWEKDPEKYVEKYYGGLKEPQTVPMAVGTCFDAQVKSKLEVDLGLDKDSSPDKWYEGSLTITGPERDTAIEDGEKCLKAYEHLGNYNQLLYFIKGGGWEVNTDGKKTVVLKSGVQVHGRPDLVLIRTAENGCEGIILDWKVNGFYSKSGVSVSPGWVRKAGTGWIRKAGTGKTASDRGRAAYLVEMFGLHINSADPTASDWCDQLGMYGHTWGWDGNCSWMGWIEQLTWRNQECTIGSHRYKLSNAIMELLMKRLSLMWDAIKVRQRPLINLGLTLAEEQERTEALTTVRDTNMVTLEGITRSTDVSFPWS